MIAFLAICYALLYYLLFQKFRVVRRTSGAISAFVGFGLVLIGGIVFSWYSFAPVSSDARLFRYTVPIVPNVRGLIESVEVEPFRPMQKGDVLFRIDPTPYEFKVRQVEASIKQFEAQRTLALLQVERAQRLLETQAAARVDLDRWTAELDAAEAAVANAQAQLGQARWELDQTVVRAPSEGYAVNVAIQPGVFVGTVGASSVLPFISSRDSDLLGSFSQSAIRHIQPGDEAEFTFPHRPGQVYSGRVKELIQMSPSAQLTPSAQLVAYPANAPPDRWLARVAFDDQALAQSLPQGVAGTMAVYTARGKPVHIVSRVMLRINAWMAYLTTP